MKPTISLIEQLMKVQGAQLVTTTYINSSQNLYFKCSNCGEEHYINWHDINRGRNKTFLCKKCQLKKLRVRPSNKSYTIEEIRKEFENNGAKLLTEEYNNLNQTLLYVCSECKKRTAEVTVSYWRGKPFHYRCFHCQHRGDEKLFRITNLAERKGSKILTDTFEGLTADVSYTCANCGKATTQIYQNIDDKTLFLCTSCRPQQNFTEKEIYEAAKSSGADIVSIEQPLTANSKVYFKCSRCSEDHYIYASYIRTKHNTDFLCQKCMWGRKFNPEGRYGERRHLIDNFWYTLIKDFYNISEEHRDRYSAHHVRRFAEHKDYRTSLLNGLPIPVEYHNSGFVFQGVKDPFHTLLYRDAVSLLSTLNKKFPEDLNYFGSTEIIIDTETSRTILSKKKEADQVGKLYIPLYFEELFIPEKAQIIYSMLRIRLFKDCSKIFEQTNTIFNKYYARKLQFKELTPKQAKDFFNATHIQGFISGVRYFGLFEMEECISAMSFGKPRFRKDVDIELLRFSTKLNTVVIGGAEKLFKNALKILKGTIISYCDLRFSSLIPENTVYARLGFKYEGRSLPGYKYVDPETNRIFSRIMCQKHKLQKLLKDYDESLSETRNMENNGFIKLYDCGNMIFIYNNR